MQSVVHTITWQGHASIKLQLLTLQTQRVPVIAVLQLTANRVLLVQISVEFATQGTI